MPELPDRPEIGHIEWCKNLTSTFPGGQPNRVVQDDAHKNEGWGFEEYPPAETFNSWMHWMYVHGKWNGDSIVSINTRITNIEGSANLIKIGREDMGDVSGVVEPDGTSLSYHACKAIGNITLNPPANVFGTSQGGEVHYVEVTQDSTGSRTIALGSSLQSATEKVELTSTPGAVDLLTLMWTGTRWYVIDVNNNFQDPTAISNLGANLQPGDLHISMDATIPSGWIDFTNGAAISRTTYEGIFARYGTMYGSGDGVNTFNVPDMSGDFLRVISRKTAHDPDRGSRTSRGDGTTGAQIGTKQGDAMNPSGLGIFTSDKHWYDCGGMLDQPGQGPVAAKGMGVVTGVAGSAWGSKNGYITHDKGHAMFTGGSSETRPRNVYIRLICKI